MTVVTNHRLGEPCWVDYASTDVPRARDFYAGLFGWTADDGRRGVRRLRDVPPRRTGRSRAGERRWATRRATPGSPTSWSRTPTRPRRQPSTPGAQVIAPDDDGRRPGQARGDRRPGRRGGRTLGARSSTAASNSSPRSGAPAWHELYARSYAAQVDFYTRVFGWKTEVLGDTADFRYATFGDPTAHPAGACSTRTGCCPRACRRTGSIYFGVADAAAACARVVELGGSVIRDPWDSEFGRFAQVTDPLGGLFFLHEVGSGSARARECACRIA